MTFDGSTYRVMETLQDRDTYVLGLNSSGVAVGVEDPADPFANLQTVVWIDSRRYPLEDLIVDLPAGIQLRDVRAINDLGYIAATGWDADRNLVSYLLKPIPEPSSLLLFGLSGVLVCRRQRL
jgi:hypothetical protein